MLWVAPELLPLTVIPGTPATQKGDVYSFGIILEEIIVRGGPFKAARQFLEPQGTFILPFRDIFVLITHIFLLEIITRVAARENPPFRPATGRRDCPDDLLDLMEKCWYDNPDDRPTFETIKTNIKCIMK